MKNGGIAAVVAAAMLPIVLAACSPWLGPIGEPSLDGTGGVRVVTREEAMLLAEMYARAFVAKGNGENAGRWSALSRCVDAFPVYNEGLAAPSYYECPIVTGELDAGYVLITANGIDLPVPEFATEGSTNRSRLAARVGHDSFAMYRYGIAGWRAVSDVIGEDLESIAKSGELRTLAAIGSPSLEKL